MTTSTCPADVTTEQLAARLTALGLKLEAIEKPGEQIRGPLVVGKVLTMEAEPQKNGKTINWCTVDVGDANGTGEPQGIVCGAHNFAPGDLVVVILPGGVLPGDFEISARKTYGHVSAGMICSSRELGIGEDHDGIIVLPEGAGEPGSDARPVLGLDQEVIEFEINPDRAYALSLRGVAREAALAYDAPYPTPRCATCPPPNDDGYPVVVDDPAGCPVFVARMVSGIDPAATTPDWMAQRLTLSGMRPISLAVDITNYVMLELGRPIHGYDADKLRARSGSAAPPRASSSPPSTAPTGRSRPRTSSSPTTPGSSASAASWAARPPRCPRPRPGCWSRRRTGTPSPCSAPASGTGSPPRPASATSAASTRRSAQAAADRVVELLVEHGGGTAEPGVTVVGDAARAAHRSPSTTTCPARISGIDIDAETVVGNLAAIGCWTGAVRGRLDIVPPPWRPDLNDPYDLVEEVVRIVGYDQVPRCCRARRPAAG